MKRRLLILILLISTSFGFSKGFFGERIFEVKFDFPVSVSNNALSFFDFMQKNVVIDLRKIADSLPNEGFMSMVSTDPSYSVKFRVMDFFHISLESGVNVSGNFDISKGLFDFLGYGNLAGVPILVSSNIGGDIFTYMSASVDLRVKKIRVGFTPSAYLPIMHAETAGSYLNILNGEDGSVNVGCQGILSIYTLNGLNSFTKFSETIENFDIDETKTLVLNSVGFDLGGFVGYEYSEILKLGVNYRVPIMPGRLHHVMTKSFGTSLATSLSDLMNGKSLEMPPMEFTDSDDALADFYINRPLKLNLYADFNPLGTFLTFKARGGVGVHNPFMATFKVYPEYYIAGKISFAGLLSAQVSSEYTDQVFIHQIAGMINIRFVELDVGVQMASTDFWNSFRGTGFGCFITLCAGF